MPPKVKEIGGHASKKGCIHEEPIVRQTAIEYFKSGTANRTEIARLLIVTNVITPPISADVHTAIKSTARKIQKWIDSYKDTEKHEWQSDRQNAAQPKRKREAEATARAANKVQRKRAQNTMSLAERNFMVALLTENPGTKTSALQFQLSNRFGSNWGIACIQKNRKLAGFNAKRTSPVNRASDPVTRNQFKTMWKDLDIQLWQCVFM